MAQQSKRNPVKELTLGELDTISRKIGEDVMTAIGDGTVNRWSALAHVAWMLERRTDRDVKLDTYLAMSADAIGDLLYPDGDEDDDDTRTDDEVIESDPTEPAPAP